MTLFRVTCAYVALRVLYTLITSAHAQTVIDQTVKTQTEVIFYVQEKTDSPYQGRLLYDAAVYASMPKQQLFTDQLAQYTDWKIALDALRNAPPPTSQQKAQQVIDMKSQKIGLDQQITILLSDPAVAILVPPDTVPAEVLK